VGYNLSPEFQNKGVMVSLNYIIDFGFNELKLDSIEAFTHSKMSILKVIRKKWLSFYGKSKRSTLQ
jgi:ribosomal-protein-alanine N-acetyltransferase